LNSSKIIDLAAPTVGLSAICVLFNPVAFKRRASLIFISFKLLDISRLRYMIFSIVTVLFIVWFEVRILCLNRMLLAVWIECYFTVWI